MCSRSLLILNEEISIIQNPSKNEFLKKLFLANVCVL